MFVTDDDKAQVESWRRHMDRCLAMVLAPIGRPDAKVTIIVRAPEALPHEAMISGNDDLRIVQAAVEHFADVQALRRRGGH
ncbi:hypothetical protein KPL78_19075 [Roseomonas sp. HJA6]|uniref:Uncharacterized protein n=1 Tax=Roseomonas alba TaxID=2846776 RepID=A0ABS7ACD9_9PROT|nr:hypothetical protein [Neoroseomonas alba]MBW6399971.1 hypothetical protein [Neoroseomonas alba]